LTGSSSFKSMSLVKSETAHRTTIKVVTSKEGAGGSRERAESEQEVAEGEHGGATSEQGRAAREYRHEIVFSARAKRRHLSQRPVSCCHGFGDTIYDYRVKDSAGPCDCI